MKNAKEFYIDSVRLFGIVIRYIWYLQETLLKGEIMRFVPASCLKPGMIMGKDLYSDDNELMLSKGKMLSETEIRRIRILKYPGIYIQDDISSEIEVKSAINSSLKNKTVKVLKQFFNHVKNGEDKRSIIEFNRIKELVNKIVDEISADKNTTINMLDLKVFDDYTYYHCVNVAVISIILGVAAQYPTNSLYKLGIGALLHDIGKVFLSKEIIDKKGKLTQVEFEEIKKHCIYGSRYLRDRWEVPYESNVAVLTHHERFDGSGYPHNLRQEKIPEFGRIITIADVFDALTSDRPYREAMQPSEAMEYIMGGSGVMFDPVFVNIFTRRIAAYPVGTCVELSNGLIGIIVENYECPCMRPKIKILSKGYEGTYMDLANDRNLLNVTIKGIAQY